MGCPVCKQSNTDEIENNIAAGFKKVKIANKLNCTIDDINYHMKNHSKFAKDPKKEKPPTPKFQLKDSRSSYEKHEVLSENFARLVDRFDKTLEKDTVTKDDTDQIVKLAREIRQTANDLLRIEGELKQELRLTRAQFNNLKQTIIRELDVDQQQIILDEIDKDNIKVEAEE